VQQAGPLKDAIVEQGWKAVCFPAIDIQPVAIDTQTPRHHQMLDQADLVIFISANAVHHGVPLLQPEVLRQRSIAAIGKATANTLAGYGIKVDIQPGPSYNSEALLALDSLQDVRQKRILIVRGEGGRGYLAEQLEKRGARVDYLEVYKRLVPETDNSELLRLWRQGEIDAVTTTSIDALDNLVMMAGEVGRPLLRQTPHVVISNRMLEHARKIGIDAPIAVADEASVEAIIKALASLYDSHLPGVEHE